jgi:hypothetical protein
VKLIKRSTPVPPIWENYRRDIEAEKRLLARGYQLTIPGETTLTALTVARRPLIPA